jgi:pyruvate/2-oxoglutarate dehydrogenase complex dihydrolipoamide dehydrogenase (E3) component
MAMTRKFDAIVIGTGQSGPPLADRLTQEGLRTAIIERKHVGGTCVNTGCIPTKTLVGIARVAHQVRRAAEYGVKVGRQLSVDMKRVKARKDRISLQSRTGVTRWMKSLPNATFYRGHARFESPRTVRINDELLEAERIFINVGARALIPQMPGIDETDYLTNSSMMHVDFLPKHLVIIGGSYIGLEFGQMYRRFGSRVTIIEQGEWLIGREDPDISDAIRKILEKEGIEIRLNAKCIAVQRRGKGVAVDLDCRKPPRRVTGSHLLLAVGRRPNTDDLGLEATGVATDARGYIQVDEQLRTNVPYIWAIGDCNGRGAFTHTSYNDFEIVAANLFDGQNRRVSDRITAYGLFIDPPLGRAGMTEAEVRKAGSKALVATYPMSSVGRARERGETQGFMKVLVDAESRKILGVGILGIGGDEVVHAFLDVMYAGAPFTVITRAMHIHPTVAEYMPTLLGNLEPLK